MSPRSRHMTNAAAVAITIWTARSGRSNHVGNAEERVFRRINGLPDELHRPAWAVMQMGSLGGAVVAGLTERARTDRCHVLATGVGLWSGVKVVKRVVGKRGRPASELEHVAVRGASQRGRGWPSGHAAVAMGVALSTTAAPGRRTAFVAGAFGAGLARIYVGAHLPSDVVAGWALGTLAASGRGWLSPKLRPGSRCRGRLLCIPAPGCVGLLTDC